MSRLRIVPIVEGHGEVTAVRILLERIWTELLHGEYIDVLKPIRQQKDSLVQKQAPLCRALDLAALKLSDPGLPRERSLILLLVDGDNDPPCELGPKLLQRARMHRSDIEIACVIAKVEYEMWFVAAANSLRDLLTISPDENIPLDPEADRLGKSWVADRFHAAKYSETVDQPRLTARMDLMDARQNSPSFDKLCRELEKFA